MGKQREFHHDCLVSWARYNATDELPSGGGVVPREFATRLYLPLQEHSAQIDRNSQSALLAASLVADNRQQRQQQQQQRPLQQGGVPPRALIICIDTSGSMMANAATQDNDGDQVSCLQLVGHAVRTVLAGVNSKTKESPVAIVSFSTNVEVMTRPTKLNDGVVADLSNRVELLYPTGTTNMWGAIQESINMGKDLVTQGYEVDVFIFTDGMPTEKTNPIRGILPTLNGIWPKDGRIVLHTFGFGPSIDSELLSNISNVGGGVFKYVSDPGMVGTVLINSVCKFIADCRHGKNPPVPLPHPFLSDLISHLKFAPDELEKCRKILQDGLAAVGDHPLALDREQMQIAISTQEYIKTWGLHFFRTLLSCHTHRHCGNFKDPGLQGYADDEFRTLQAEMEEMFKQVAPPRGSAISSMDVYVNPYGGCFSIHSLVTMHDGSTKPAGAIRRGDRVLTGRGAAAAVDYVLLNCNSSQSLVCVGGGLTITPWHPIRVDSRWIFPHNHPQAKPASFVPVVTLLLVDPTVHVSCIVDGVEVITLAHGIVGDAVASHSFYGTERVVDYIRHLASTSLDAEPVDETGVVCDDIAYLHRLFHASPLWCKPNEVRLINA